MERLEGLDEEFQEEETEKVTSIEEAKKKRPPCKLKKYHKGSRRYFYVCR